MMNILQTEDLVKSLPDQNLIDEAQAPTGKVPQYLVISEIQRRTDMRKRFANQKDQPQDTVADQIIGEGIRSIPPQVPPSTPYPLPRGQGLVPSDQHFPPPGNPNAALLPPGMADGGIVQLGAQSFTFPYEGQNYEINAGGYSSEEQAMDAFLNGTNQPLSISAGTDEPTDFTIEPNVGGIGSFAPVQRHSGLTGKQLQLDIAEGISVQGKHNAHMGNYGAGIDITDLVEQQKNSAYSNALIQLGAGIAGNDLATGLSRAGTAATRGMEAARNLDLRGRLLNRAKPDAGRVLSKAEKINAGLDPDTPYQQNDKGVISLISEPKEATPLKKSVTQEKIDILAAVIYKRRNDPDDSAFVPGGFTQEQAQDEASQRELVDKGTKVLESGNALEIDPLALEGGVVDKPIEFVMGDIPRPSLTAMEVSDNVAGPVAKVARFGEQLLSAVGLNIDSQLTQQRSFVLGMLPELIRSRSVNKGKTSLVERRDILSSMGIEPGFFTGPAEFEGNIKAFDKLLSFSERSDIALLNSTGISRTFRDKVTERLSITRNARALLGNIYLNEQIEIIPVN